MPAPFLCGLVPRCRPPRPARSRTAAKCRRRLVEPQPDQWAASSSASATTVMPTRRAAAAYRAGTDRTAAEVRQAVAASALVPSPAARTPGEARPARTLPTPPRQRRYARAPASAAEGATTTADRSACGSLPGWMASSRRLTRPSSFATGSPCHLSTGICTGRQRRPRLARQQLGAGHAGAGGGAGPSLSRRASWWTDRSLARLKPSGRRSACGHALGVAQP